MKGRYHDDWFLHFMAGVLFTGLALVFLFPSFSISQVYLESTYDSVRGFVDECEDIDVELGKVQTEVAELKDVEWYKESQRLLAENKQFRDNDFAQAIFGLLAWFAVMSFMIYVVNRYQTNKIKELEKDNEDIEIIKDDLIDNNLSLVSENVKLRDMVNKKGRKK